MKEDRLQIFGRFVVDLAKLSKCSKRGVAAIITDSSGTQVYSIGVNGGPNRGLDCLCTLEGKYSCIHAEANALAKCTSTDQEKVMICTLSPCVTCASLIVNSGFKTVHFISEWKDTTGIDILRIGGVTVQQLHLWTEGDS